MQDSHQSPQSMCKASKPLCRFASQAELARVPCCTHRVWSLLHDCSVGVVGVTGPLGCRHSRDPALATALSIWPKAAAVREPPHRIEKDGQMGWSMKTGCPCHMLRSARRHCALRARVAHAHAHVEHRLNRVYVHQDGGVSLVPHVTPATGSAPPLLLANPV